MTGIICRPISIGIRRNKVKVIGVQEVLQNSPSRVSNPARVSAHQTRSGDLRTGSEIGKVGMSLLVDSTLPTGKEGRRNI